MTTSPYAEQLATLTAERDELKRRFDAVEARADREGRLFSKNELDEVDGIRRSIRDVDVRMAQLRAVHEPVPRAATRTTTRTFTLSVKPNPTE